MIAAVKYARADRELKPARPYGKGAQGLCIFKHMALLYIYCLLYINATIICYF